MNYLLIDPKTEEVREFRLDVWDRHDLLERQKMGSSLGSRHKKLEEEKKHIKSLAEKIKTSGYFRNLSPSDQKLFLNKGRWTNLSVLKIADKANIHRTHSEYIYKFMSNYSHCEAYALMQIHSIKSPQDSKIFMNSVIGYTEMFLSLTLKLFRELGFNDKSTVKFDDELSDIIDFWEEFLSKDSKDLLKS